MMSETERQQFETICEQFSSSCKLTVQEARRRSIVSSRVLCIDPIEGALFAWEAETTAQRMGLNRRDVIK